MHCFQRVFTWRPLHDVKLPLLQVEFTSKQNNIKPGEVICPDLFLTIEILFNWTWSKYIEVYKTHSVDTINILNCLKEWKRLSWNTHSPFKAKKFSHGFWYVEGDFIKIDGFQKLYCKPKLDISQWKGIYSYWSSYEEGVSKLNVIFV